MAVSVDWQSTENRFLKTPNWVRIISDINNHRWLVNGETSLTCDDFGTTKKVFRSKLGFPMAQTVRRASGKQVKI